MSNLFEKLLFTMVRSKTLDDALFVCCCNKKHDPKRVERLKSSL